MARALQHPSSMNKTDLRIGSPCSVDWAAMTPADKGRFCADCKKVVHELSRMTEGEVRTLLGGAKPGQLCVRYVYDRAGKVFFAGDAPASPGGLVPSSFLSRAKRAALVAAAIAVPLATAACGGGEVMGDLMGGGYMEPVVAEDGGVFAEGDARVEASVDARPDGDRAPDGGDATSDAPDADPDAYVIPN